MSLTMTYMSHVSHNDSKGMSIISIICEITILYHVHVMHVHVFTSVVLPIMLRSAQPPRKGWFISMSCMYMSCMYMCLQVYYYTSYCQEPMYHISYIIYHISYIIYHVSYIMCHISCVIYHVSYIMCHISCAIYHVPYIMHHII